MYYVIMFVCVGGIDLVYGVWGGGGVHEARMVMENLNYSTILSIKQLHAHVK